MKNKIRRISFYDFDGTLFKTFDHEKGLKKWENVKQKKFPSDNKYDWWKSKHSLDVTIFNFIPYKKIVDILNHDNNDDNTVTILLTSRDISLKPNIINILKENDINFNKYLFKSNTSKVERINEILMDYPDVEVINLYDDRKIEIDEFKKFKDKNKNKYLINLYKVTNGNSKLLEGMNTIRDIIREEIKYKFTYL